MFSWGRAIAGEQHKELVNKLILFEIAETKMSSILSNILGCPGLVDIFSN